MFSTTSLISSATVSISFSTKPLVVMAAVPNLMPEVINGDLSS